VEFGSVLPSQIESLACRALRIVTPIGGDENPIVHHIQLRVAEQRTRG
jgi:hypothetical protein